MEEQQQPESNNEKQEEIRSSTSSSSLSSDYENYVIKANLCGMLSRELKLDEIFYDEMGTYEPPTESGLSNSNVIIPAYYHIDKHPSKIIDIDYYEIIKDDIRNYRALNSYQLEYIRNLTSHELKNELIEIFNECIKMFNELISLPG